MIRSAPGAPHLAVFEMWVSELQRSRRAQDRGPITVSASQNVEIGDQSLEKARLQAAPYFISKDLRHGYGVGCILTPLCG
jgi:hypothetical protein